MDINKLIMDSIQEAVNAGEVLDEGKMQEIADKVRKFVDDPEAQSTGVQTHLGRAAKRVGMALGGKYDEAAKAGVGTHLGHAGKRALHYVMQEHPAASGGAAAAVAAGLGALALAKKMRGAKKGKK